MRARRLELRLLAVALVTAWAAAAALVLVAYRPGGPLDILVGLTMLAPLAIAVVAVRWPPVVRGQGAFPLMVTLGVLSLLLLIPSIGGVLNQILALGSQTLMPSLEAAYPWVLALIGTSLFAAFGLTRTLDGGTALRPRRLAVGIALGMAIALATGAGFAAVAIANELALRDDPTRAAGSRFGPIGTDAPTPTCDASLATVTTARVFIRLEGEVDLRPIGTVDISGVRLGDEFRWLAYVATDRELGHHGEAWVGGRAFVRTPALPWRTTGPDPGADGSLDLRATKVALPDDYRITAEDRGEEVIEGAPARRCRIAIDGSIFRAAFPQVSWLVGNADLGRWRGQLDYWVFLDGQLGQIAGTINGAAFDVQPDALQGTISVLLTATERGRDVVIYPPAP